MNLEVNNIRVRYKDVILAIRGFSITVKGDDFIALLGNNGAGKSTVLRAISGVLNSIDGKIDDGTIFFNGQRIDRLPPHRIVQLGILQVPEGRRLFPNLTLKENILQGAFTRKNTLKLKEDYQQVMEYFPNLKGIEHKLAGYLSGGEQQMVAIGRSLMGEPKMFLLDEPSLGLAPLIVDNIFKILQRINREKRCAILLVEQNAFKALCVCRYGYIMENGAIVLDGVADRLMHNTEVREFYFGIPESGRKKTFREIKHYRRKKRWLS